MHVDNRNALVAVLLLASKDPTSRNEGTRVRLRVQTTHSGHMGWKRARHNALTTAETPVTNEQNARNYR